MLKSKILKFGKSFKDVDKIKSNFFFENNLLIKRQNKINRLYISQPKRKKCKACQNILSGNFFINHNIKYIECKKCTHINGAYQDTQKFANKIYIDEKANYSQGYKEKNIKQYALRQKKIYDPKADFLKKNFKNHKSIEVLDIGAGSGYFVSSLIDKNFKNVEGLEVSKNQILFGKNIFKAMKKDHKKLQQASFDKIIHKIKKTNFSCVSLIGVLEHMIDMSTVMEAIKKNRKIKFLYVLVPMSSFICIVENLFPNIFNRHLGGGHTHLFTEKSLKMFMNKYNFVEHSSWWFGTDIHDLYRSIILDFNKKKFHPLNNIAYLIKDVIDNMQFQLDKKRLSSEVHMLLKRR